MTAHKHVVTLEQSEVEKLRAVVRSRTLPAWTLIRARVLLMANDATGEEKTDQEICRELHISNAVPKKVRKRYVQLGLEAALKDAPRPGKPKRITPEDVARVTAIACTDPPEGYDHWSLRLLESEATKQCGQHIGRTSVQTILLSNKLRPHLKKNVVHSRNKSGI